MFWVISEMENGESSGWMGHNKITHAREDARAQLENGYAISYIYSGDKDEPDTTVDYLEKLS